MRIKSYFAHSVQDAIEKARIELGPDAMLINSKQTDPELRQLGGYEVVFGVGEGAAPAEHIPKVRASHPGPLPASDILVQEIAELRKQIETVKRSVSRNNAAQFATGPARILDSDGLVQTLTAADFSENTAQDIVQAVEARLTVSRPALARNLRDPNEPVPALLVQAALVEEIEKRFSVLPQIGPAEEDARILVLVGPPGAGKTTTLVKLALKYGVLARKPVQILSTDTLRVGGSEQLAAYTRIIGVGYQAVHSTASLGLALEEYRSKKLILIDTPGYTRANIDDGSELANFFNRRSEIEVQLTMPAVLRYAAASRIFERFAMFGPAKLLLTHFDEADAPGAMLELAIKTGLPISYLATGQQIPEDLEEASKAHFTSRLPDASRLLAHAA